MSNAGRPRLVVSIALAAALGFAPARAAEDGDPDTPPPARAEPEATDAAPKDPLSADPSLNPLAAFDKAALEASREAPLFTPSRRRPAPPVTATSEPPPPPPPVGEPPAEPPSLKLSGVVEGPAGAIAFVRNEAEDGRVEQLRLGDQIGGWLVTEIGAGSLKLTLDDRDQEYRLFERRDASSTGSKDAGKEGDAAGDADAAGKEMSDDQSSEDEADKDEKPRRGPSRPRIRDHDDSRQPTRPEGEPD